MKETKPYSLIKKDNGGEFPYLDQDGCSHESPQDWLWHILGGWGCGCGSAGQLAELALWLLNYYATPHEERDIDHENSPYENLTSEVIARWMSARGLIEHGGSVGGAWLDIKGDQIYLAIKALTK